MLPLIPQAMVGMHSDIYEHTSSVCVMSRTRYLPSSVGAVNVRSENSLQASKRRHRVTLLCVSIRIEGSRRAFAQLTQDASLEYLNIRSSIPDHQPSVPLPVTRRTQGNEIVVCIVAQMTPLNEVMNLQLLGRAAFLTAPSVASKYLLAKAIIFFKTELESRSFLANSIHALCSSLRWEGLPCP
jgi:hypothetical protein